MSDEMLQSHAAVAASLRQAPVIGVVRTPSVDEARRQASLFMRGGLELVEITFSVPGATELVKQLRDERGETGPPWIGMGTVTNRERAQAAVVAGAEFIVSPNTSTEVAAAATRAGVLLVLGALTCSEIVTAHELGAHIVKVYPLPPVGGARYLATVRQPLDDIPMLAAGGFEVAEIPEYRAAGASAFGIGSPLLAEDDAATLQRIDRALRLARGEES